MKKIILTKIAPLALLFIPGIAYAQPTSLNYSLVNTCDSGLGLSCAGNNLDPQFAAIATTLISSFGGILFAMMIFYGFRLVIAAREDNTITETKMAFAQALMGTALTGGAALIANTFAVQGTLVDASQGNLVLNNVIGFLRALVLAAVMFNLVIQGYRLITAQDESGVQKGRKKILHAAVGAGIVLLVDRMIAAVTGGGVGVVSVELAGIARFLLTIFGALAVIGILAAGVMLIVSVDESLKDKAKKLVIACMIALVIVIASYGIIDTFAISI